MTSAHPGSLVEEASQSHSHLESKKKVHEGITLRGTGVYAELTVTDLPTERDLGHCSLHVETDRDLVPARITRGARIEPKRVSGTEGLRWLKWQRRGCLGPRTLSKGQGLKAFVGWEGLLQGRLQP